MPRPSSAGKSSGAETLIKNLRLLDIDEEFDWPEIGTETFGANSSVQDQHERCYAGQWLFYKLFIIWDPEWVKDALEGLFPPLEPKQGNELRLRIYKQLATLKQNGTFPNDLTLRRTMFDDCKGPKFEELLTTFSSLVLQRAKCQDVQDQSRVAKIARGDLAFTKEQKTPLVMAYRSSCTAVLKQRKGYEQNWRSLETNLGRKESETHAAAAQLEHEIATCSAKRIPRRTVERLRSTIQSNWIGESKWIDNILEGEGHRPKGTLLERPYSEVWTHACRGTLYQIRPHQNDSLLEELQSRVEKQNTRLTRWRSIQNELVSREIANRADKSSADDSYHEILGSDRTDPRVLEGPSEERHEAMHSLETSRSQMPNSFNIETPSRRQELPRFEKPMDVNDPATPQASAAWQPWLQPLPEEDSPAALRDALAEQIVTSVTNAAPTPARAPLTLVERTRLSMARLSPRKGDSPKYEPENSNVFDQTLASGPSPDTKARENSSYASLAERTRQSISHTNLGSRHQSSRKPRISRVSNVYPVNQFETPRKIAPYAIDSPNVSVLEERLDALAVDDESAFLSRPLLAKSPTIQPISETDNDVPEERIEE